jgi:orotate phosphoribosyltransferase
MISQKEILEIFTKTGALMDGHFELTSGLHSQKYFQCALVLQHPHYATKLCLEIAGRFKKEGVTVVVGPAVGGIIVAYEVGRALGVRAIYGERENGRMVLRRGFAISKDDRVLVVEDVITTGGSAKEVIYNVWESGAFVVGVGAIVDRSGGTAKFEVKCESLAKLDIDTYYPVECPLCAGNVAVVKPGSRGLVRT